MGPGDSVTALIDDRIWLWNEPSQDGDFFSSAVVLAGEMRGVVSSFILIITWLSVLGVELANSFVHGNSKSNDDWSVVTLSGFTVISLHMYLWIITKKNGLNLNIERLLEEAFFSTSKSDTRKVISNLNRSDFSNRVSLFIFSK